MPADSGTPRVDPRVPPVGTGRVRDYPLPEAIIEHSAEGLCVCHEIPDHPRDLVISTSIVGEYDGAARVMALVGDVSERKRAERITMRRAAILDAVAFSATTFLSSLPNQRNVQQMLERLGGVTSASRAYIFENSTGPDGEILSSQRFEWCRLGIVPQIDNRELQELPLAAAGFDRWIHQLSRRGLIAGKIHEFPEPERALLQDQDIRSLAVAPIFVGDRWWGLMGFDDCRSGRRWSGAELLALQTAADILGAALLRQKIQTELEQAHAELKRVTGRSTLDG